VLTITKLAVSSFNLDHLDLFWEIGPVPAPNQDNVPHEIYNYDFYILRSEAAMGPFDRIGGPFRDTYHFRDNSVQLLHKWRQFYYKVLAIHRTTGEEVECGPSSYQQPEPDLIGAEIIRQEDILFREFVGRKCYLYPARTFGPLCSCFDLTLQRKTRGAHLPCFGTGWMGGYMSPVELFVQIDPSPKQTSIQQTMEMQPNNTTARTSPFPPISPRDILIETENKRWRVVSVSQTQRLRSTVHQELVLHEIPRGDIEYALPVNLDLRTLEPSAERNFKNAQNIANDGDFSDILAGKTRGSLR
jgi:hypothetical protein